MKEKYYVVAKTISRWKIDSRIENFLGYMADRTEFWKRMYILYYKIFDRQYYQGGIKRINEEIKRQRIGYEVFVNGGGDNCHLQRDLMYSLHRYGVSFEEYFIFKFYEKNHIGRRQYNNLKLQYGYCELLNKDSIRDLFEDKGACYRKLKKYYKRELIVVRGDEDLQELTMFIRSHKSFIVKPLTVHSGTGIKIVKDFYGDILTFFNMMKEQGAFVLEELINQHPAMSVLHPESINTVRLATFKMQNEVYIVGAALRMGTGHSNVDNAGAGGIYAGIDLEHGFVCSMARDNQSNQYSVHPDTKCKLVGFDLPEWRKAIELVKELASVVEGATVISWDLAYSDKGWLVVEGNDVGEPYLLQAPLQIGLKDRMISLIDKYFQ